MPELRQSLLTGRWVAVAPGRSRRPGAEPGTPAVEPRPERDRACPFCPGNEEELPEVLLEVEDGSESGWAVRVVSNRYPAFRGPAPEELEGGSLSGDTRGPRCYPAAGRQEVIIETPRHDLDPATLQPGHLDAVVDTYFQRIRNAGRSDPRGHVSLFRNHLRQAGASLLHPHAQLIALPYTPPRAADMARRMEAVHRDRGQCVLCNPDDAEPGLEARLVAEDAHLRAWVPWAAESALEVWIVPRRHRGWFGETDGEERKALSRCLGGVLGALRTLAGEVPYNYMLHTHAPARARDPALHWFLQLRPRTHQPAGFELASGITINPTSPEEDAHALREAWEGDT